MAATTSGQGSDLLPAGYLSTSGNQIVDSAGQDVRIESIGWNQDFSDIPATVNAMAADGFNTIRIDWFDATLSSMMPTYQAIVAAASAAGMKVIFDHHGDETPSASNGYLPQQPNGLPFDSGAGTNGTDGAGDTGTVTEQDFVNDTQSLAKAFAGNATVVGFDLDNEPLEIPGGSTWGTGGPTDLQQIYEQAGDAIQAVDPGALIIAEGPQNYSGNAAAGGGGTPAPYGDLSMAGQDPVTLTDPNKVVYSVHIYPQSIAGFADDSGSQAVADMNNAFGYLETDNIAPVWIGEMGASLDGSGPDSTGGQLSNEQAWASTLVAYLNGQDGAEGGPTFSGSQQAIGTDWWAWGDLQGQ
jgi:aryl-phospho-beta-D-glucosidase BglC (GH1 family)